MRRSRRERIRWRFSRAAQVSRRQIARMCAIRTYRIQGGIMAFFDPSEWDGKIFSSGFVASKGGSHDIMEPASGNKIGSYGEANAEDVSRAAAVAAAHDFWAAAAAAA